MPALLRTPQSELMSLRNLSTAIRRSYLHAVAKFRRIAWGWKMSPPFRSTWCRRAFPERPEQIVRALRFFYSVTLDRAEIPRAKHRFRRKSCFHTGFDARRNWIAYRPTSPSEHGSESGDASEIPTTEQSESCSVATPPSITTDHRRRLTRLVEKHHYATRAPPQAVESSSPCIKAAKIAILSCGGRCGRCLCGLSKVAIDPKNGKASCCCTQSSSRR